MSSLIEMAKSFNMPKGKFEESEKGRQEFVAKFPISRIESLTLDEYCIGTTNNSFCYWLEFKDILFGIGGGNASKFGIYKSKNGNYCEEFGKKKKILKGPELERKFLTIKESILQGLELVEQNKITEIRSIQTPLWNMVFLKIFSIYYPEKFLTIGDPLVILECARSIELSEVELTLENSILLNYLCRKKINETPPFSTWDYEKIGTFIWNTFHKTARRNYYIIGSKYGVHADIDKFPEMLEKSVVATGFAREIELSNFYNENHAVIKDFLDKQGEDSKSIYALKHFLSIKPGDLIAVKSSGSPKGTEGYLSIVAIAEAVEVNGEVYEHDPKGLGHIIYVNYLEAPIFKELTLGGYGRTIHKLSNNEHVKLIFGNENNKSYFPELKQFIAQSNTKDLKTSRYLKKYQGLSVKVSFGQGNTARIPWISFLKEPNKTSDGIYPVYLYYKSFELLILAYGISETKQPSVDWSKSNKTTIEEYFKKNYSHKPERYGASYVYKVYEVNDLPSEDVINEDLNSIIKEYKELFQTFKPEVPYVRQHQLRIETFSVVLNTTGLTYSSQLQSRFIASLLTKPFVILTGLSGSGKTKLAQAFVQWICASENQYKIIPVGADWTNREPLLGYPNGLEDEKYVLPDSGALQLVMEASEPENSDKPYFMILDEMNLSHVEYYFADFLSIMESRDKIKLYSGDPRKGSGEEDVKKEIGWPENLFIIGTVNIDETTYMFSPKVLDRANVIEFRIEPSEMEDFLEKNNHLDMHELFIEGDKDNGGLGQHMAADFLALANTYDVEQAADLETLNSFFKELQDVGAEFGYRSASEIRRLIHQLGVLDNDMKVEEKIDIAIMQKLLPKLHGSRKKLVGPLETLAGLCLDKNTYAHKNILARAAYRQRNENNKNNDDKDVIYRISFAKIERMIKNATDNGFTSYAEA